MTKLLMIVLLASIVAGCFPIRTEEENRNINRSIRCVFSETGCPD